jgi:flagellar basal body P-ring formation protein FlgA
MRIVAILAVVAGLAHAACIAVPSSKILARDLSAAVPLFQALDPDAMLGFAPFPGTVRVLSSRDMVLIGRRYGLAFPPAETVPSVCIERIVRHLSMEEVRAALLSALNISGVRLEVLEFSNQPLPPGELAFRRTSLNKPPGNNPQTPIIWPGKLIYDDQHSLAVWARVRISVDGEVFLAAETIPKGTVIRAEQIAATRMAQFPLLQPSVGSPLIVAGKVARRTLQAGQPIVAEALDELQDVLRGETVHVQAIDGAATIRFDAVAQSSGRKGDIIVVHNPSSGRNFRALIDGREQVVVRGAL